MATFAAPSPGESERLATQFSSWYPLLIDATMKSRTIALNDDFLEYLREDGIVLPKSVGDALCEDQLSDDEDVRDVKEDGDGEEGGEGPQQQQQQRDFPELDAQIREAIAELGGSVFPKLNWSCPLDAAWMNAGSLKCQRNAEVYVLLKSSDRVIFDIECMLQGTGRDNNRPDVVTLVLRKWANLQPSMEFRVFIYKNTVVGICQRDCTTFYEFLTRESEIDAIVPLIDAFCRTKLLHRLPIESFVADIYIDRQKRVWVVDVNVFGPPTCSLLFEWEELVSSSALNSASSVDSTEPRGNNSGLDYDYDVRIVESQASVLPSEAAQSKGPIDVTLAPDFHRFMEICKSQRQEEDL